MASPSFLLPFAHWDPDTSFIPPSSTITVAKFLPQWLLLGLSCGELLLVSTGDDPTKVTLSPHARLSGHKAAMIALDTLLVSTEGEKELLLVSLDSASRMSKWSLSDGRCLQSVSSTISSKPRGFRIIERYDTGIEGGTQDPVIIVYGCSTEIVVLNAETLEKIMLWTGGVDWPLPAVAVGGREILTLMPEGKVQGWVLEKRLPLEGRGAMVTVSLEKDYQRQFSIEKRDEWGVIMGFERASEKDYILVQCRGIRIYATEGPHSFILRKSAEMNEGVDIVGYEVFEKKGLVFIWTSDGNGCIIQRGEEGLWGHSGTFFHPESVGEDKKTVVMAFTEREGSWVVTAFSQSALRKEGKPGTCAPQGCLAIGIFSLKDASRDIEWSNNNEVLFTPPPPPGETPLCTCSAIFANMMVFAHGCILRLHTLPSFLLSYNDPIKQVYIPTTARICLLKRVRVGEYIGSGRHSGVQGGKEYLVVGSAAGELFIVETPSFQSTKRLPLSATPISSANLLPSNLGKRLRSTLFISSADGTASIVDVERARIMATFPSHDYLHLISFATKPSQNIVLLTYEDSARREWDLGEEEGGVLKPPPSSRGSDRNGGVYAADLADEGWREVRVGNFEVEEEDRGEEGEGPNGDGTMKACQRFCGEGLPAAVVDVKSVLETLKASVDVAKERTRRSERVVVGNHPALITAKSLLTALVPSGIEGLLGYEKEGDHEWWTTVAGYFFKRKMPAVLGQIGAGRHISLLSLEAVTRTEDRVFGIGNTVTSIVLLTALSLVGGLLVAAGKEEFFDTIIGRTLENQREAKKAPALGVFAKYWMDRNSLVRKVARTGMHICMQHLTDEQKSQAVGYWSRFLPVLVPPELFSSKDVVRSVVILGKLTAGYPDKIEVSVKKNVALSIELLLGDSNPHFQDTAIKLVGDGWSAFQSLFDPAEVIHMLIRISSSHPDQFSEARRKTLHNCILSIARSNSPLLGSGLANNIAHGTSSPAQITATTMSTAVNICVAAMRIVNVVVREDAILFRDVLNLIVAAVVKILDPSSPLREKVLPTVTELVNEMVEAYPSITFHRPTQRLALSVSPGIILIFDLKSATEMNILQGHHNLANFLSFNLDGKYLVAVDLEENILFVWKFVTGILSFIGGSDGPPGVLQPKRKETFQNLRKVGVVDVEWTGEKSVKITAGTEVTALANVEGGKGESVWGIL